MRQVLEAETPVVTIVGKTWDLHVTEVLRAPSPTKSRDDPRLDPLRSRPGKRCLLRCGTFFRWFANANPNTPSQTLTAAIEGADRAWSCAIPTEARSLRGSPKRSTNSPKLLPSSKPRTLSSSVSILTTIAAWRQPTALLPSTPAPRRSRARSTATVNAPATAT